LVNGFSWTFGDTVKRGDDSNKKKAEKTKIEGKNCIGTEY
jgi:hypothetical protein